MNDLQEPLRHIAAVADHVGGAHGGEPVHDCGAARVKAGSQMPLRMPRQGHVSGWRRIRKSRRNSHQYQLTACRDLLIRRQDDARAQLAAAVAIRDPSKDETPLPK